MNISEILILLRIGQLGEMLNCALNAKPTRFVNTARAASMDEALDTYQELWLYVTGLYPQLKSIYPTRKAIDEMLTTHRKPIIDVLVKVITEIESVLTEDEPEGDLSPFSDFIESLDIDLAA